MALGHPAPPDEPFSQLLKRTFAREWQSWLFPAAQPYFGRPLAVGTVYPRPEPGDMPLLFLSGARGVWLFNTVIMRRTISF